MTICEKLCNTLAPMNLTVAEGSYNGKETEYFTFNIFSEHPVLVADDECIEEAAEAYLHYFTKDNSHGKKNKIKKLLRDNDIGLTDVETLYEKDTGYTHLIFQIQITDYDEESEE